MMYDQGVVKIYLNLAHNCKLGVKSAKFKIISSQHMKNESALGLCQKQSLQSPFWEFF
jgi:hypothetical protein